MFSKGLSNHLTKLLMQAHAQHGKPSQWLPLLFKGESWRYRSMQKTLETITNPDEIKQLQKHAQENLIRWQKQGKPTPEQVIVIAEDWGTACLELTQESGTLYTVLNHANKHFPGGGFLRSGNAQEENIWHRSTCALSLEEPGVYFDNIAQNFVYENAFSELIAAQTKFSQAEQYILKKKTNIHNLGTHQVYISERPRLCFRGSEVLVNRDSPGERGVKNTISADPDLSFQLLPSNFVFPFYEMRSAAPNLSHDDKKSETISSSNYKRDIQRCIAAQLDTLILKGRRHVILGAWGCGEFHNSPSIVAQTYQEEISIRAEHFNHIVFAILNTASHHCSKFNTFASHLAGIKLGTKAQSYHTQVTTENAGLSPRP